MLYGLQYFLAAIAFFITISAAASVRQVIHNAQFQPDYVLRMTYEETSVACRTRYSALVNGSTPGPAIYMRENQTTWVRVYNDMQSANLTVHWHGLSQSTSPFSDGTPLASQWPIPSQNYFDYEIKPRMGEAGTYFYHSHISFQAVSVGGPLIVVEQAGEQPPYKYDGERILFISELFNKTGDAIESSLTASPASQFGWSGEAETLLLNGKSYKSQNANQSETPLPWDIPAVSAEPLPCGPEIIEIEPEKIYRVRTIGGTALSLATFSFEDHQDSIQVIAADAAYTQSVDTDHIQVGPGQRFDFLLRTKSEAELQRLGRTSFWMQMETRLRPTNVTSYALLMYKTTNNQTQDIPSSPPTKQPLNITQEPQYWLEQTLLPLKPNGFPSAEKVTRQVVLTSLQVTAPNGIYWSVQNRTWTEVNQHLGDTPLNASVPPFGVGSPYLVNVYKYGDKAIPNYEKAVEKYGGWDPQLNIYPGEIGEVIDVILVNEPSGTAGGFDAHAWHIHGGSIYDLGSGPGAYNATAVQKSMRQKGYTPVLRDTTYLYKYTDSDDVGLGLTKQGWRAWRVKITNPGVWMVHCHLLQHMIMGMQAVFVFGNASEIMRGVGEPFVSGYLSYGGSAYGNASYDPLVNHYFD